MNRITLAILAIFILLVATIGGYYLYQKVQVDKDTVFSPSPNPSARIGFETTASATPIVGATGGPSPSAQPNTGAGAEVKNIGISISQPKGSDKLTSPVKVIGSANVFEGHVVVRVKAANGKVLGQGTATACMDLDACPFTTTVSFEKATTTTGSVEAFSPSPKDGSEQYLQTILIRF